MELVGDTKACLAAAVPLTMGMNPTAGTTVASALSPRDLAE
jgi:hypothetical protein